MQTVLNGLEMSFKRQTQRADRQSEMYLLEVVVQKGLELAHELQCQALGIIVKQKSLHSSHQVGDRLRKAIAQRYTCSCEQCNPIPLVRALAAVQARLVEGGKSACE